MSWITPITDRSLSDIATRNSKAFFNLSDWARIGGNFEEVHNLIISLLGVSTPIGSGSGSDIDTFPPITDFTALINNINRMQAAASLPVVLLVPIANDLTEGPLGNAPDFNDVNNWELALLLIYTLLPAAVDYQVHCGVANCGQSRFWQSRFRG